MTDDNARRPPDAARSADHLRGLTRLAVDATTGLAHVVEEMHGALSIVPTWLGSGLVYATIRGLTRVVGAGLDRALALAPQLAAGGESRPEREHLLAALNGVFGDHLAASGNPLAIEPRLRRHGRPLELTVQALAMTFSGARDAALANTPAPSGDLLVLVHGSSMSDVGWLRQGHDHGAALERDLGSAVMHFHYNSGLHVSTSGSALSDLLEQLVQAWPVPVTSLTLVTHSMGGLVARSACHLGAASSWLPHLRALVFLGTPHHGAPLERGGNWLEEMLGLTPWTRPLTRLARIRSAGVTDLRYGSILDGDWHRKDRFQRARDPRPPTPLPTHVACYAVAAAIRSARGTTRATDGLVPIESALGHHRRRPEMDLAIPPAHQHIAYGTHHLDLLSSAEVYDVMRTWLGNHARSVAAPIAR